MDLFCITRRSVYSAEGIDWYTRRSETTSWQPAVAVYQRPFPDHATSP
jgi:hypothetical protein